MYGFVEFAALGLLTILSISLGILLGMRWSSLTKSAESSPEIEQPPATNTDPEKVRLRKWLAQMYSLSHGMTAGVTQHCTELEAINQELQEMSTGKGSSLEAELLRIVADTLQSNGRLQAQLSTATETLAAQSRELEEQLAESLTDALTGIPNRRAFDQELSRKIAALQRYEHPFSLILLDVDHFKKFNDQHGHLAGDTVLKQVAKVLEETLREVDHAARYGGEEFAAILTHANLEQAKQTSERIRAAIESLIVPWQDQSLTVTASIGVTEADRLHDCHKIIERADRALYAAKQAGRNRAFYHAVSSCLPVMATSPKKQPGRQKEVATPQAPPATKPPQPSSESLPVSTTESNGQVEFSQEVRRRHAEWHRHARPVSIMILAIDQYPELTHIYGEHVSQLIQETVSRFLSAAVRETDLISQVDAATFGVVLPGSKLEEASTVADRVRVAINLFKKIRVGGEPIDITISAGVTQADSSRTAAELQCHAEESLRLAQALAGNVIFAHDGQRAQPASQLFELVS